MSASKLLLQAEGMECHHHHKAEMNQKKLTQNTLTNEHRDLINEIFI